MTSFSVTMKRSISLTILSLLLLSRVPDSQAKQREFVPGMLRSEAITPSNGTFISEPCDGTWLTVCESCDSIKVCISSSPDAKNPIQKCPTTRPYCSMKSSSIGASCQSQPDDSCNGSSVENSFLCTGTGFYPDPETCHVYHYCEREGAIPDNYDCPEGYKYNSKAKYCQRSLTACEEVICKPNDKKLFVPYPGDPSYYVFCQFETVADGMDVFKKAHIFTCGKRSSFNVESGFCEFKCPWVGMFVNTANPRQYYSCYWAGLKIKYTTNTCKAGQIFDETRKRCIVETSVEVTTKPSVSSTTKSPDTITDNPNQICVRTRKISG